MIIEAASQDGSKIEIVEPQKKYEDLYGLLNTYSKMYIQAFANSLNNKLMNNL